MAKKIIIAGVLILAFIITLEITKPRTRGGGSLFSGSVSPDIMYITSPVTSFSGKVERVSGDGIVVSQEATLAQVGGLMGAIAGPAGAGGPAAAQATTPSPTPKPRKISYTVTVGKNTIINRPSNSVPYLLKTQQGAAAGSMAAGPGAAVKTLTVNDIEKGEYVSVNSAIDLRTVSNGGFEATSINLPPIQNSINGKVVDVRGSTIRVKAMVGGAVGPAMMGPGGAGATSQEKEFDVTVTKDTEISRYGTSTDITKPSKPEVLGASDLKKDVQVTVYTDADVSKTTSFTALLINPAAPITGAAGPAAGAVIPPVSPIPSEAVVSPTLTTAPTKAPSPTAAQ